MLISPSLTSKPSFRKHSCLEKLFDGDQLYQHSQEKQPAFSFAFPSSPSKKTHPKIFTCICFFFLFITMVAYLRCSSLDTHAEKASPSGGHDAMASSERLTAMPALRGLGSVYRKGSRAMSDLVVAHVAENTSLQDLRLFLRTLHRSGVTARADIVFLFPWNRIPAGMVDVIHEENTHSIKLMQVVKEHMGVCAPGSNASSSMSPLSTSSLALSLLPSSSSCVSLNSSISPFNLNAHRKSGSENDSMAQPLWGVRNLNASESNRTEKTPYDEFGSMVGFSVSELNPDNALQGFINHPPLALRRWACYQMLLGMVRHKFKYILLTDVSGVAILRDPFTVMGKKRAGLYVSLEDRAWGTSIGKGLGVRLSSLDMEPGIEPKNVIALQSAFNTSGVRRQLYSHAEKTWSNASSGKGSVATAVVLDDGKKGDIPNMSGYAHTRRAWRKAGRQHIDTHRRGSVGRRRRSRKAAAPTGGLYEHVYGRRMWSTLEENERKKKLVNSAVIVGSLQQVRGLANTMVTEIVKVALERKNRDAFPDSVLLSYLLHKSTSVLGKKVVEHLHLMDNVDSYVHSLVASQQPSLFLKTRGAYSVVHGTSKSKRWEFVVRAIRRDICASLADATVYNDCEGLR